MLALYMHQTKNPYQFFRHLYFIRVSDIGCQHSCYFPGSMSWVTSVSCTALIAFQDPVIFRVLSLIPYLVWVRPALLPCEVVQPKALATVSSGNTHCSVFSFLFALGTWIFVFVLCILLKFEDNSFEKLHSILWYGCNLLKSFV